MLEILSRWNRWGNAKLESGILREITSRITSFLDSSEIIVLMGPRRAGKTTVLFQLMDLLENAGVAQQAMLHVNFEEPALALQLGVKLLNQIYESFREEMFPEGKVYLFLDEIQNVPGWERWVRARNETEKIKIFLTGSSSQLMSKELATLLTGRHVSFQVFPLNFKEFLKFRGIKIPAQRVNTTPVIQNALRQYIEWGGFPAVVLAKDTYAKELLLKQYFDDVLFKDVALRHAIRDAVTLRNLAVYLLTQTASIVSFQRISKLFGVSLDLANSYCHYLQEAFLIEFAPFYSEKVGIRLRNPHKVHAIDLGLRRIANLSHSPDKGRLIETIVFNELQQRDNNGIFYWRDKKEIDLLVRQGNTIKTMIQVTYEDLEQSELLIRELSALTEAKALFPKAKQMIITQKYATKKQRDVEILPLWRFLI